MRTIFSGTNANEVCLILHTFLYLFPIFTYTFAVVAVVLLIARHRPSNASFVVDSIVTKVRAAPLVLTRLAYRAALRAHRRLTGQTGRDWAVSFDG